MSDPVELLFFDTFAHDNTDELNLDLVQFPKPVYVTEVRIIPLGARVQADFPGGVRLGATNPSQFQIEFFVNDLAKPGASTFETLGGFEYNQNGCINLECLPEKEHSRKIPTDGLVLRGWYTTITLAVYGTLTNTITEQIIQPVVNPTVPSVPQVVEAPPIQTAPLEAEWTPEPSQTPAEFNQNASYQGGYTQGEEPYQNDYEYYSDAPKDPRYPSAYVKSETEHRRSRDYSRERDWSERRDRHDYRSRTYRAEDERKRPRSPPQSPNRPHSPRVRVKEEPVELEISEEEPRKDVKIEVKIEKEPTPPVEEVPKMDVGEFEPILSDEEIVDEELDYDYSVYTNNDDLIKLFIPGVTNLRKFEQTPKYTFNGNVITMEDGLRTTLGILDDFFKSSITKYSLDDFPKLNTEIKEEFIHLCERFFTTIGDQETFCEITEFYTKVDKSSDYNSDSLELAEQAETVTQTLCDWLKIALDYEMANQQEQPVYKIRHIKCGVRLAEFVCHSADFIKLLSKRGFSVHKSLLSLYEQEYMALSIKLAILKALDTYLRHKNAIELFLCGGDAVERENGFCIAAENGYKCLVEKLRANPSVRLKFALNSILKKLNLYEVCAQFHATLSTYRNKPTELAQSKVELVVKSLDDMSQALRNDQVVFLQPKRFLPVSAQFEVARCDTSGSVHTQYYRMFDMLQCFFVLLTAPNTLNLAGVKTPIFEILSALLQSKDGLRYLSDNCATLSALLRCLLSNDEDYTAVHSHNLGLELAYHVEGLFYVDSLKGSKGKSCDSFDILDLLHGFCCLSFSQAGRLSSARVLTMGDNIECLLHFIDLKEKSDHLTAKIKKSPGLAYIVDLIYNAVTVVPNVRFLESYHKNFLVLADHKDSFDETCSTKLAELKSYLSPLELPLNYDNVAHFVELIEKESEHVTQFAGNLITTLRILEHLGISQQKKPIVDNPLVNYVELKYKHVILQLFSLDATSILTKLAQKVCDFYNQPALHSASFVSHQGHAILATLEPCVNLLHQLLTYVIQCRNTNFRDLTTIPTLLHTYNLCNSFPTGGAGLYVKARDICKTIVHTLLVYTQPVSDEIHEKDSLNKTLWASMCSEVIKFVMTSPNTFISGLLILSELLPLPLPIQTVDVLSQTEVTWVVNLRKLWSAHLHPHSVGLQDLIGKLCMTSHHQLLNLLRRVCVQLADLAANTALMVARGILDCVIKELAVIDGHVQCSSNTGRLLNFLACLVTHATLKCAVLHLIQSSGKDEKFSQLLKTFAEILRSDTATNSHTVQCQECVLSIVQSFCDTEITLMQHEVTSDIYLSNALPSKDTLNTLLAMSVEYLQSDGSFVACLPALRTLLLLTEHDYGFCHLREALSKIEGSLYRVLSMLAKSFSKDSAECLSTLNVAVELVRVSVAIEEVESSLYAPRTVKMSLDETRSVVGWKEGGDEQRKHPFLDLEDILKKLKDEDITFETLLEGVTGVVNLLRTPTPTTSPKPPTPEPQLPEPEPLLSQFSSRLVFTISDVCDERLSLHYWLSATPTEPPDPEPESDTVPCDLVELARANLTSELNITRELERLSRTCASDEAAELKQRVRKDEKKAAVAAATAARNSKATVAPLRTRVFQRNVQQRSDLFRSRPPNTSRPPSLHVDDFVALETCGAQPTGPTGYNKFSREVLASSRVARGTRGRAFVTSERAVQSRQMAWWGSGPMRGPY